MGEWKPCQFDRREYLEHRTQFEQKEIDDFTDELCEFNEDAVDLAAELTYTRFALASLEDDLRKLVEELYDLGEAAAYDEEGNAFATAAGMIEDRLLEGE